MALLGGAATRRARRRALSLSPIALVALLAGCDGGGSDTAAQERPDTPPRSSSQALAFDQVEDFTIEQLEGEVGEECTELEWIASEEQKRLLAPFKKTKAIELLGCDEIPYLAYIEYGDAAEARTSLAAALLPYLIADRITVVIPLAGIDEEVAADYLTTLKRECGCGEIVKPGKSAALR